MLHHVVSWDTRPCSHKTTRNHLGFAECVKVPSPCRKSRTVKSMFSYFPCAISMHRKFYLQFSLQHWCIPLFLNNFHSASKLCTKHQECFTICWGHLQTGTNEVSVTLDLLNVWKYPVLVGKAELSSLCFISSLCDFHAQKQFIFNFHCSVDASHFFSIVSILRVSCAQDIKSTPPFVNASYKTGTNEVSVNCSFPV